ncbi:unnamed protein product [Lampetra planeri]
MVFFTCDACGESVKKAQVEKHLNVCRNCQCLSCIDCGKDFRGQDYKTHLRCISENEKYGGKGFEAKANKGDVKQQLWLQKVQDSINAPGISPQVRDIMNSIVGYDNVPRKKPKFQNWMKNSLRIHKQELLDRVWEVFSSAHANQGNPNHQQQNKVENEETPQSNVVPTNGGTSLHDENTKQEPLERKKSKQERKEERQKQNRVEKKDKRTQNTDDSEQNEESKKSKKKNKKGQATEEEGEAVEEGNGEVQKNGETGGKKKRKRKGEEAEEAIRENENSEEPSKAKKVKRNGAGKFNWKGTITAVLRVAENKEMSVKKLRKKVLGQYLAMDVGGKPYTEEELLALFNKKIQSNPKFRVLKDKVVRLVD